MQEFGSKDIQQGPRDRDRSEMILSSSPVFVVGDSFYRSRMPKSIHWSVAWSDLMMTMFVLFLTLFVYQVAHREFLNEDNVEVVSGASIDIPTAINSSAPIVPIAPALSDKKADAVKRTEPINAPESDIDEAFSTGKISITRKESNSESVGQQAGPEPFPRDTPAAKDVPEEVETGSGQESQTSPLIIPQKIPDVVEPRPILETKQPEPVENGNEIISDIYDLSRYTVESEKLEKFASVELVPDKTVRIILTGDLLFESGQAVLSSKAKRSLKKLAKIIQKTPYMINVNGHTDNIPMHSQLYPTNWELSVARASRVARFLIQTTGMPGTQFRVSGFSFFRPVKSNTSVKNRATNRRVEIIISREPPEARMKSM